MRTAQTSSLLQRLLGMVPAAPRWASLATSCKPESGIAVMVQVRHYLPQLGMAWGAWACIDVRSTCVR